LLKVGKSNKNINFFCLLAALRATISAAGQIAEAEAASPNQARVEYIVKAENQRRFQ
jgi:hypothetical protein